MAPLLIASGPGIPVPDIGHLPPPWSAPSLSLLGGGLAILALLAFVVVVFSARRLFECGISPWAPIIVTGVVFVLGVGTAYVSNTRSQHENRAASRAYWAAKTAAQNDAAAALDKAYGLTIDDPRDLPVRAEAGVTVDVVLTDGTAAEYWVGTYGGVYEMRGGGTSWSAAAPIPLAEGGA